jgi:endonuclease-3
MKSVTAQQIQKFDRMVIEQYGFPSIVLMENAGREASHVLLRLLRRYDRPRVCVVCGLGNNAGDGLVIARYLINAEVKVDIFMVGEPGQLKEDAAVNYRILERCRYPIYSVEAGSAVFRRSLSRCHWIIDALFGVGLAREIGEPFHSVIAAINQSGKRILAVDIPSGLEGTAGRTYGICVRADITVTFSFVKKGLLMREGPAHAGRVIVADIGIPQFIMRAMASVDMAVTNDHIGRVIGLLKKAMRDFPDPSVTLVGKRWKSPFLVLISCILSLRTKDGTTLPAAQRLFALADLPQTLLKLPTARIAETIYPVGFYKTKAKTIHGICRDLLDKHGGAVPADMDALLAMKGVGRKTANLVLTEGFGIPAICVDTHVHRISNRLGYVATKTPEETERALRDQLPSQYWIEYNAMLVTWGQNVCKPVSPLCSRCPIYRYCARCGVKTSR